MSEQSGQSAARGGEWRKVGILAGVFGLRMLGLFMLLPVLSVYARSLPGSTPMLVGLAVGGYGITQAALQIPFGLLSDRYGRRIVIMIGMLIFAAGSVLAATSHGIYGVIAGRAVQGAGAVSAAITAFVADLTLPQYRTRAMALLGVTIGLSFMVAFVAGPALDPLVGVPGLFWLAAIFATAAALLVGLALPGGRPTPAQTSSRSTAAALREVMADARIRRLDASVFLLHFALTASFVGLPLMMQDRAGLSSGSYSLLYLAAILVSLVGTVLLIYRVERGGTDRLLSTVAFGLLGLGIASVNWLPATPVPLIVALAVFFSGFNFLEARLPAAMSHVAASETRGAALGSFAMSQFLGAFCGGWGAGVALAAGGVSADFYLAAAAGVVGALVARTAAVPQADADAPA